MARTGDGVDDKILAASTMSVPTGGYTWCTWYQNALAPTSTNGHRNAVSFSDSLADPIFQSGLIWHSTLGIQQTILHRDGAKVDTLLTMTTIFSANTWYHIAGRYNGGTLSSWVNGAVDSQRGVGAPTTGATVGPCALAGASGTSNFDDGRIAEVAFWNISLTDNEISMLANGLSPIHVRPESLNWYIPIHGASPEPDYSSNVNNGNVTGTTVADHPPVAPQFSIDLRWMGNFISTTVVGIPLGTFPLFGAGR